MLEKACGFSGGDCGTGYDENDYKPYLENAAGKEDVCDAFPWASMCRSADPSPHQPKTEIDFTSYDPAGPYFVSAGALEGEPGAGYPLAIIMTVNYYQVDVLAVDYSTGAYLLIITETLNGTSGVPGYEGHVFTNLSVEFEDGSVETFPLSTDIELGMFDYTYKKTTEIKFDNAPVDALIYIEILNFNAQTFPPNELQYPIAIP